MRLTAYTDYTLRTLIFLAIKPSGQATIAEVARAYGISEAHLTKVAHHSGLAGDVATVRGRRGGLRLGRPPEAISLGAVVRRTESDFDLVMCFEDAASCPIVSACVLRTALKEALAAFLAVLDRYTLADLVAPRSDLAGLVGLSAAAAAASNRLTG
jgi:Rrf2 family nitric oxide-sensitive transcriptional repressor